MSIRMLVALSMIAGIPSLCVAEDGADKWQPTVPQISFQNVRVAKLRDNASEPTITLIGQGMKREMQQRIVAVTRVVQQEIVREVIKNGKKVEETVFVPVEVQEQFLRDVPVSIPDGVKMVHIPAKEIQAWDIRGKSIPPAQLLGQLAKPRHVLLLQQPWRTQAPIDVFYRSVLNDDVLFLYVPQRVPGPEVPPPPVDGRIGKPGANRLYGK